MLISLQVKNLALIEEAEIEFGEGLNVFSGETGAGKSLVIGSIGLALGGRAHGGIARDSSKPALVELVFSLDSKKDLDFLRDLDIPVEDEGQIIIRRIFREGRSSAKINGLTVNNAELKNVAQRLIDIHGQHEHQSLLYEKNHITLLDRYGSSETEPLLKSYKEQYREYTKCRDELEASEKDSSERQREADLLKYEISEIEAAALKDGEDKELENDFRFMNNSRKIEEAVSETEALFSGDEGVADRISRALRSLSPISELDSDLQGILTELNEIESLISDFDRDLEGYRSRLSYSEEDYMRVSDRLDLINSLKRKHGSGISDIIRSMEEKKDRLKILENYDDYRQGLQDKLCKLGDGLDKLSGQLSKVRVKNAKKLEAALKGALQDLNFNTVEFEIRIISSPEKYRADGIDEVSFMISTNPGESLKPLQEVASGGELSRIMLALKTVLSDTDEIETLIFDEIDTGISGRTAQKVSESLLKLSRKRQIILITHLPQIAAMADRHFLIEKSVSDGRTVTGIEELSADQIVNELSRLLSGAEITDKVHENAYEMKTLADQMKREY